MAKDIPQAAAACYEQLLAGFAIQSHTAHVLAPDPENAEIILAPIRTAGYGLISETLRASPIYRRHAGKLVVYSPEDGEFPAVRGLYPSVPRKWVRRGWAMPAHYISTHIHQFVFRRDEIVNKDILLSFVGSSRTHPVREKIVRWRDPAGVVIDSSSRADPKYWWEKPDKEQLIASYRDITRRSKFVVCPRGVSASSIRLFEAMEAGAVPVIVADDLELPLGPAWEEFSLRVRERDVDDIPKLVERWQGQSGRMGREARLAWESYFSPGATVGSIVRWAGLLLRHSGRRPAMIRLAEFTSPRLARTKVRHLLSRAH
ncbi:MAG: exostosin family protein [Chthoniobacterales bacterium]